jgi:glycosyltransferase involved in cell wall biosynthesis
LGNKRIVNIPNTLDTNSYKPIDARTAREKLGLQNDKIYILFGAMNIVDERKGFTHLLGSLAKLASELVNKKDEIEIIIFGKANEKLLDSISFKVNYFGNFKNEENIIYCYNAADIFIAPSLQDNLPNTVLESLSCGTPVVAYNVGGLPDMIDHLNNGYLAEANSVEDLANGLKWYLKNKNNVESLSLNARNKVIKNFSQKIVAGKYEELYRSLF